MSNRKDRWIIFAQWDETGDVEEIDVDATSKREAIELATNVLVDEYEPGWKIAGSRHIPSIPGVTQLY